MDNLVGGFVTGVLLGASNGISPGPLSFLAIAQTLQSGWKSGMKVACSPLVTDLPIIALSLLFVRHFAHQSVVLSGISIAGALFLFFLAYQSYTYVPSLQKNTAPSKNALYLGVMTNFLNPYPYVFWITVGAPFVNQLIYESTGSAAPFFLGFYLGMVGCKAAIVVAAVRGRQILSGSGYGFCMKATGVVLFFLGLKFSVQSYHYFYQS